MMLRIRKLIGDRTIMVLNAVTMLSVLGGTCLCFLLIWLLDNIYGFVRSDLLIAALLSVGGAIFVISLLIAVYVGYVLGYACLPVNRLPVACLWVPIFSALGLAVPMATRVLLLVVVREGPITYWPHGWPPPSFVWLAAILILEVGYLFGWAIARRMIRHRLKTGTWQVIGPLVPLAKKVRSKPEDSGKGRETGRRK